MTAMSDMTAAADIIAPVTQKMIIESNGSLHDINHFLKVWAYARTLGQLEQLPAETQFILEVAALVHDIACPSLREQLGKCPGPLQEAEGRPMADSFLRAFPLTDAQRERIATLVGTHHTFHGVEGIDHQILIEADFLVNADEASYSHEAILEFRNRNFRTASGTALLNSVYGLEAQEL